MAMTQFDNRGQVSLWKNDTGNEKAPVLSGKVVAHRAIAEGETLDISLWKNESDHPQAPVLKGKMGDVFKKTSAPEAQPAAQGFRQTETENPNPNAGFEDDSLPF